MLHCSLTIVHSYCEIFLVTPLRSVVKSRGPNWPDYFSTYSVSPFSLRKAALKRGSWINATNCNALSESRIMREMCLLAIMSIATFSPPVRTRRADSAGIVILHARNGSWPGHSPLMILSPSRKENTSLLCLLSKSVMQINPSFWHNSIILLRTKQLYLIRTICNSIKDLEDIPCLLPRVGLLGIWVQTAKRGRERGGGGGGGYRQTDRRRRDTPPFDFCDHLVGGCLNPTTKQRSVLVSITIFVSGHQNGGAVSCSNLYTRKHNPP